MRRELGVPAIGATGALVAGDSRAAAEWEQEDISVSDEDVRDHPGLRLHSSHIVIEGWRQLSLSRSVIEQDRGERPFAAWAPAQRTKRERATPYNYGVRTVRLALSPDWKRENESVREQKNANLRHFVAGVSGLDVRILLLITS
jgi:hypothetical protein